MATMAAECSSALTGLGPSMARDSQNENGSCAALPSAASEHPGRGDVQPRALRARQVGQGACRRYRPARRPPRRRGRGRRCGWSGTRRRRRTTRRCSCQAWPMSAYGGRAHDLPAEQQRGQRGRGRRDDDRGGEQQHQPVEPVPPGPDVRRPRTRSTSRVTTATVGRTSADSGVHREAEPAAGDERHRVLAAVGRPRHEDADREHEPDPRRRPPSGAAARSARRPASTSPAPHTAGTAGRAHSAVSPAVTGTGPWPCRSCRCRGNGGAAWPPRSPSPSPASSRR